jgi:RNA polymerase sigma-70 factor (ECF subfamily)
MKTQETREQRFVALYERFYSAVLAYARRRVDEPTARDITAETFLVAWRRLDEADDRGLPWLYRTAALTLKNWERTQRRTERVVGRLAALPTQTWPDPAHVHADRQPMLDALRQLPETDRELLMLVVWEQLDVRTAAAIVGCSKQAASVRLHRARRRLRAFLPDPKRVSTTPIPREAIR